MNSTTSSGRTWSFELRAGKVYSPAAHHSCESLTGYDSRMRIVPALAERWETPDDNTYIFHLRRGVKFYDWRISPPRT